MGTGRLAKADTTPEDVPFHPALLGAPARTSQPLPSGLAARCVPEPGRKGAGRSGLPGLEGREEGRGNRWKTRSDPDRSAEEGERRALSAPVRAGAAGSRKGLMAAATSALPARPPTAAVVVGAAQ